MSANSFPLEPQSIQFGAAPPFARTPDPATLFLKRAERFNRLASLRRPQEFFVFLEMLTRAQHAVVRASNLDEISATELNAQERAPGSAPLAASTVPLGESWRAVFNAMLEELGAMALPGKAAMAVRRARELDGAVIEAWAGALLDRIYKPVDPAIAPLIDGALQVYWAQMASRLLPQTIVRPETPGTCPVCGCAPISGIIAAESALRGNRYLVCSLCATQWHMVRIKCSNCESTEGLAYYGLEGEDQALKAETCEKCKFYLKLMYLEKAPDLDPVADDVGSIALDVLLAEAGWRRPAPVAFVFTAHQ